MHTSNKHSIIIYSFLFITLVSCNRFYKPVAAHKNTEIETIRTASNQNKFLILRDSSSAYSMQSVRLNDKNDTVYARLGKLEINHTLYVTHVDRKYTFKKRKGQNIVLDEVHLYSDLNLPKDASGNVTIPLTAVQLIEKIEFDKKRTTTNHILGYTLGLGAIIALFLVATPGVANPYN